MEYKYKPIMYKNSRISLMTIFDFFVLSLGILLIGINSITYNLSKYLLLYCIIISLIIIVKLRKSQILVIMMLYMSTYLVYLIPYFFYNINIAYYTQFQDYQIYSKVLNYHSIFLCIIYLYTNKNKINKKFSDQIIIKDNSYIYIISIIAMIVIFLIGKVKSNNFIDANSFGLAIYEYFYLFFILAYKYSGKKKGKIVFLIILSIFYILKGILLTGRIESIQMILLLFTLFYENKIKNRHLILFFIIFFMLFGLYGNMRSNNDLNASLNNISISKIKDNGYMISNQGDVFYNSVVYVGLINNNILNYSVRVKSFIGFLCQIFLPSSYVPFQEGSLSNYSKVYAQAGGGGLITTYFYVWGGVMGVVIISLYISKLINNLYYIKNQYVVLYVAMMIITYPRWFAYSPITLFKLCLYIIPIGFIFSVINKFLEKNKQLSSKVDKEI